MEWYNENELRKYPFSEDCSLVSDSGSVLPNNLIVDLKIRIKTSSAIDSSLVECAYVKVTPYIISIGFTSQSGVTRDIVLLCSGTFQVETLQRYHPYRLTALHSDVDGWIVFGSYEAKKPEYYRFLTATEAGLRTDLPAKVDTRAIKSIEYNHISRIQKQGTDQTVTGDVELIEGEEVRIGSNFLADNGDTGITFRLRDPKKFIKYYTKTNALYTINGVSPDKNGMVWLKFR